MSFSKCTALLVGIIWIQEGHSHIWPLGTSVVSGHIEARGTDVLVSKSALQWAPQPPEPQYRRPGQTKTAQTHISQQPSAFMGLSRTRVCTWCSVWHEEWCKMGQGSPTTCSGSMEEGGTTHPNFTVTAQPNRFLIVFKKSTDSSSTFWSSDRSIIQTPPAAPTLLIVHSSELLQQLIRPT